MIIHRDYRSSSDSIVKIFDNKIEFYNPGHLLYDLTVERLLSGKYKSTLRNKMIAGICKDMQLIEKYGSGIRRICDYFKEAGLPEPVFEIISEGFQVTVFGDEFFNETKSVGKKEIEKFPEKLPENAVKIFDIIKNNPYSTLDELSNLLSISRVAVKNNLSKLKEKGLIERIGAPKGGYWKIIKSK